MKMLDSKHALAIPAYVLFFTSMFVPTAYVAYRGALLVCVLAIVIFAGLWRFGNFRLHSSVLLWTLFLAVAGLAFSLYGVALAAPGAIPMLTVYFVWPIVFTFMIGAITRVEHAENLARVMVYALIAISVYSLSYILNTFGVLPNALYIELDLGQYMNKNLFGGFIVYWMPSVASLIFLVPFVIAMALNARRIGSPIGRFPLALSVTIGVLVAVLTGKKAVWVTLMAAPLIALFFIWMQPSHLEKKALSRIGILYAGTAALAVGVILYVLVESSIRLDVSKMLHFLERGFDFTEAATEGGNVSAAARTEQYVALMDGWRGSPYFGNGLGAVATVIRSGIYAWAYELSYVSLLFQTGVVGVAIYAAAIGWVYWRGIRIVKAGGRVAAIMLPTLVGLTCFLMANATNPYLAKFDYMWVIFFPVALINLHLLNSAHARS